MEDPQTHTISKETRSFKEWLLVWIKGLCMGVVEGVPGVSAGTIALITGILPELLRSLRNIEPKAFKILFKQGIPAAWRHVNANFLIVLAFGLFTGFLFLIQLITHALENFPIQVWSFFFGLIAASSIWLAKQIDDWATVNAGFLVIGIVLAYSYTIMSPGTLPLNTLNVFLGGMFAICAMLLPGLSGSFILLLAGLYAPIMGALKALDLEVISVFMAGAIIGIIGFSHILSWLFDRYQNQTLALLTGIMIGSLNKVWPWKEYLSFRTNSKGEEVPFLEKSISPAQFEALNSESSLVLFAIGFAFVGAVSIFLVARTGMLLDKEGQNNP